MTSSVLYLLMLLVFVLSLIAQGRVQKTFDKYSNERAYSQKTGREVASELMARYGTEVLSVSPVAGSLTDHYDPKNNYVGLSSVVYGSDSVSALAVTAHEIGHVLQYQEGYGPIRLRNAILPVASFGSTAAPWIVIAGLAFSLSGLAMAGVYLFGAALAFQLITLPVEFNASSRGLRMLEEGGYIDSAQEPEARAVLRAAAMTYVWAAIASLINFLRMLAMVRSSRRRN